MMNRRYCSRSLLSNLNESKNNVKSMVGVFNIGRKTSDQWRHDFIQKGWTVFRRTAAGRDNGSTRVVRLVHLCIYLSRCTLQCCATNCFHLNKVSVKFLTYFWQLSDFLFNRVAWRLGVVLHLVPTKWHDTAPSLCAISPSAESRKFGFMAHLRGTA